MAVFIFVTIFAACLFGILTRPVGQLAAFWPANALLLGIFVRMRGRVTGWHWLAAALAYGAADAITGSALSFNVLLNLANLFSVAVGFILLRRVDPDDLLLRRPTSVLRLVAIVTAASAACGLAGAVIYPLLFSGAALEGWKFWFATELVNYMAILPIILTWPQRLWQRRSFRDQIGVARRVRQALPFVAVCASCAIGHLMGGPGAVVYPVPALLWCALDYRLFSAALLSFGYSAWALGSISAGALIILPGLDNWDVLMSLRLGIMLIALGPLIVASVSFAHKEIVDQLRTVAMHDQLTGILNRRAFIEGASELIGKAGKMRASVAVAMIDIDHFKSINDTFGHTGGDCALNAFALLAGRLLGPGAVFGRVGGEEFAVVLDADRNAAEAVVERLRTVWADERILLEDGRTASSTVSIGLVTAIAPASVQQMLAAADRALYSAKSNGRNRVETAAALDALPGMALERPKAA